MNRAETQTIISTLWPTRGNFFKAALITVLGSLLLAISAKIKIPLEPVPVTMQLFVVLALSLAFGARLAVGAVMLYLLQGAAGLPVFTGTPEKGIGLAYMIGGTGGYLIGFVLAAGTVGWLADRGFSRNVLLAGVAALIGVALIYIPGLLWMGALFGWDKPILAWGFWPFIGTDLVKAALAALAVPATWQVIERTKRS